MARGCAQSQPSRLQHQRQRLILLRGAEPTPRALRTFRLRATCATVSMAITSVCVGPPSGAITRSGSSKNTVPASATANRARPISWVDGSHRRVSHLQSLLLRYCAIDQSSMLFLVHPSPSHSPPSTTTSLSLIIKTQILRPVHDHFDGTMTFVLENRALGRRGFTLSAASALGTWTVPLRS